MPNSYGINDGSSYNTMSSSFRKKSNFEIVREKSKVSTAWLWLAIEIKRSKTRSCNQKLDLTF